MRLGKFEEGKDRKKSPRPGQRIVHKVHGETEADDKVQRVPEFMCGSALIWII